jgi:ATP-binding cassette subfamily B protein
MKDLRKAPLPFHPGVGAVDTLFQTYKKHLAQVLIGLVAISVLQLIFPFLTQSLVDIGIAEGNIGFIKLVLLAQVVLFIARLSVEFIRSWIMLHVNTRVNIALIADFLIK